MSYSLSRGRIFTRRGGAITSKMQLNCAWPYRYGSNHWAYAMSHRPAKTAFCGRNATECKENPDVFWGDTPPTTQNAGAPGSNRLPILLVFGFSKRSLN
jgi:hypothetical protein